MERHHYRVERWQQTYGETTVNMMTIIISNYNQEEHIAQTIDSVFAQRVNFPFKVIIADDFSCRDRSRDVIRDYASRYDNIEAIFAEENKGYLTNILRAKARTKTKYFCLLDADDYWTDRDFLQRAYNFLNTHEDYSIYEANVEASDGKSRRPYISPKRKSGTYSREMYLNNKLIPVTQTTGMVFRNCIFAAGIPKIMEDAVGTRSERSFEGDTGRFIMHLKHGPAYYDNRIVGVYRVTQNGIWTSLSEAKKRIITARFYPDYYQYFDSNVEFFVNRAYKDLQRYLAEKEKELACLKRQEQDEFMDEYERLMFDDVYRFCKRYEKKIVRDTFKDKVRKILKIIRE